MESWDQVDDQGNNSRHDESVCSAGYNVGDLDIELLVVVVEPTAVDDTCVDSVEPNDVIGSEKGVEDEADHSSNTVLSEHIHAVVDADPELDYNLLDCAMLEILR